MPDLSKVTTIEDLRLIAKRRVPKMFYDYVDSGAYTESTYLDNQNAFNSIKFNQRIGINLENRTTNTNIIGQDLSMPVVIAPTGLTGMQYADGEILAAKAAKKFGIPYTLSTLSICSIEDIAKNTDKHPFWFQLYVMRDKGFLGQLIDRAKESKCSALVLTMDLQIIGQRHKDIKNGLSVPPKLNIKNIINLLSKPRWCGNMLTTRRHSFGNIVGHLKDVTGLSNLAGWISSQFDVSLCWDDVAWIKNRWGGKLIIKGVMHEEDAKIAINNGADAIVISNHGGRQLDGAPATIDVLPRIADKVGNEIEIMLDGGIRSGQDVLKAIALGAKACAIGRAYLYGLGAYGEAGVTKALEIIHKELDTSMAFCGHKNRN